MSQLNRSRVPGDGTTNDSSGDLAQTVVVSDKSVDATPYVFKVSAIGHAAAAAVELDLTGRQITRYRFKPDSAMRVAEDAINRTQAEAWLQVGVTPLANGQIDCRPPVDADAWSEWRYFPEGNYLTNLWFACDTNVTGKLALVEAE